MRSSRAHHILFGILFGPLLLAGCDFDAAVFVEATFLSAAASVTQSSLAAGLSGQAQLNLHLGERASEAGQVELQAVSINRAADGQSIIASLGIRTDPAFPISVAIDSDVLVTVTFVEMDNEVDVALVDALCAGEVVLSAILDDSLRGGTIEVASSPFSVAGCP